MLSVFKSKLAFVLLFLLKSAPVLSVSSMGFRFLFLGTQVVSIWFIFSWVGGSVNQYVMMLVGLPETSYVYPGIGAAGFIGSTIFSLLSKVCALKATYKFEKELVKKNEIANEKLTKGDLKNIVKLMVSSLDSVVPLTLITCVSVLWVAITPYVLILIFLVFLAGLWFVKKGVGISAKRYKSVTTRSKLDSYIGSEEHSNFYKILLLPSYLTLALISVIAISVTTSLIATKVYFASHASPIGHMAILTGVAFLQIRSFISIILRAGAYNKSLTAIYRVLASKQDSE